MITVGHDYVCDVSGIINASLFNVPHEIRVLYHICEVIGTLLQEITRRK